MLKIPAGGPRPDVPILGSKPPTPDEIVILAQPMLKAVIKLGDSLVDLKAKWAVEGDAGEIMLGVNLHTDCIDVLTTKEGTAEICAKMAAYQTLAPAVVEQKLERLADIGGEMLPVYIRSNYAELKVNGVLVKIFGDEQIKVGEWEWGDPLDYEPDSVYVTGTKVPIVPLRLKSELDLGLGWLDRVELISDAVMRSQHRH